MQRDDVSSQPVHSHVDNIAVSTVPPSGIDGIERTAQDCGMAGTVQ